MMYTTITLKYELIVFLLNKLKFGKNILSLTIDYN